MTNTLTCDQKNDQVDHCACNHTDFSARFDILETADELILQGDMPGVAPDDLEVLFEDRTLTIHGNVAARYQREDLLLGEYKVGDFSRSFTIGESIDTGKISAELSNGVVTVHLPKTEETKPRRIEVKS